ncbi:hypothetical protein CJ204_01055 [Corynebacterium xerosis]|uniref:N-acetylmuramoyl-L-alanine amidase domain-containing protein n=1 Tax=Corynebacterium xerosis TaxID=1725 RepID=A0A2N6T282_9CORY|nr:glycoside hydrolase domain-containing protein [Corynebacterium xerosis]PMC63440.1 hypothetical protein CJ204_01055 [Corynebacterium xerosis]
MSRLTHPMKAGTYTVSSGYGPRWGTHHNGVDFAAPVGTPIYAAADGVVVQGRDRAQGTVEGFGSWIWIDSQESVGLDFIYGHVKHAGIVVKRGDRVRAGQMIGVVGNEGQSTGPHLHFECWGPPGRIGGKHRDPAPLLDGAPEPDGAPAPKPHATVIDTAARPPAPSVIKAAGHIGHVVYVSPDRTRGSLPGKPVSRAHVDAMRAAGLSVAAVWQYGKDGGDAPPDFRRGHDGGVADARAADKKLDELGLNDWPVFFAVDVDIDPDTDHRSWEQIRAYMRGAASAIGRDRVGIYGGWKVVEGACRDGLIANLHEAGKQLAWQTLSWSAGRIHSAAVLYQRVIDTARNPGPKVGGVTVDVNDVLHPYWGQLPRSQAHTGTTPGSVTVTKPKEQNTMKPNPKWRGDPTFLPELLRLFGVEVVEHPGWRERGQGDFTDIVGVMCHHTGAANTSPKIIAEGHSALRGLLSQIHLSPTGVATICGAGIAYHAGEADPGRGGPAGQGYVTRPSASGPKSYTTGNARMIGIEAQHSGNPKDPWPEAQMEAYARICAALCWFLGWGTDHVVAHKEYAPSRKVDPTFPMEGFRRRVQWLLDNPPINDTTSPAPAPAPVPKEDTVILNEKIRSIINPTIELNLATLFALLDAYAWEQRAAMKHLYSELGLDYDTTIAAAVAADREEKK